MISSQKCNVTNHGFALNIQLNASYKIKLKSVFSNLLFRSLLVSILSCSSVSWWQHGISDLSDSVLPPHISEGSHTMVHAFGKTTSVYFV